MAQQLLHLARADHASLIDHDDVAAAELRLARFQVLHQRMDGLRGDPARALQPLRRLGRQRRAFHLVALLDPGLARGAQQQTLPGPGVTLHTGEPPWFAHVCQRGALLRAQHHPLRRLAVRWHARLMAALGGERLRALDHSRFQSDHLLG